MRVHTHSGSRQNVLLTPPFSLRILVFVALPDVSKVLLLLDHDVTQTQTNKDDATSSGAGRPCGQLRGGCAAFELLGGSSRGGLRVSASSFSQFRSTLDRKLWRGTPDAGW